MIQVSFLFSGMREYFDAIPLSVREYVIIAVAIVVGALLGLAAMRIVLSILKRRAKRAEHLTSASLHRNLSKPLSVLGVLLGILIALGVVEDTTIVAYLYTERIVEILIYGVGAWVSIQAVEVIGDVVLSRYSYSDQVDNYQQRKVYTQMLYIKRVVMVIAVVIAFALVLFQFEGVRELGAGLLASAGVAGIAIGFAAQKSLANLLAGFQIAFTQPIRIDDQVVVNGEFGRVEEITLTYVVIKIWDERRLIVPLNHFIDNSFQNWSRHSTELLGAVMLYLDYGVDLSDLRSQLQQILDGHELWDKRVGKLQVTDTSEHTMTVRVLVSASNPGDTFSLRCDVREQLLEYLRLHQPEALPQRRLQLPDEGMEMIRQVSTAEGDTSRNPVNQDFGNR